MARIPIFFRHTFPVETYGALYNPDAMAVAAKAKYQLEAGKLQSAANLFDIMPNLANPSVGMTTRVAPQTKQVSFNPNEGRSNYDPNMYKGLAPSKGPSQPYLYKVQEEGK